MALTSLLVCSDAQAVQVLSRILQDMGISVETCSDLRMARARLDDRRFDALLVDCLDEKAAMELIVHVRNAQLNKNTVAIAIVNSRNEVRDIFAGGVNFILYKPISRERATHSMRAARGLIRRERRVRPRMAVQADATIAYAGREDVPAALVDLSEEGIAVRSNSKLPPYCKVYFQFALPGNSSVIRLSGEVMWQDSAGRVGIRFAHVPQTSRRVLNHWLETNLGTSPAAVPQPSEASRNEDNAGLQLSASLGLLSVSADDRRNLSRRGCCLGAEIYRTDVGAPTRCTLTDISPGGCYLETTETLPVGTALEVVVRTEDLKLQILGKVQSTNRGFGMGIKFTLRTEDQREQVEQLIARAHAEPKLLT